MGNWSVTINGIGPHHNDGEHDVERLVGRLLDELVADGHNVHHVEVVCGSQAAPAVKPATADRIGTLRAPIKTYMHAQVGDLGPEAIIPLSER